jgi:chemotaxis protein MotB
MSSNKDSKKMILIRRKKSGGAQAHHGGAWKVAYADFVTAMMAFFLLMWLLSSTSKDQKEGLADFFDPKIPIVNTTASGSSVFGGDSVLSEKKLARSGIGGSGKKTSTGRDDNQKKDTATTEDVFVNGTPLTEKIAHDKNEQKKAGEIAPQAPEVRKLEDAKREMERRVEAVSPDLKENLQFKMTEEGLRIDITDREGKPMFLAGSVQPTERMKKIMGVVGSVINDLTNSISITGHTDSSGYSNNADYTNWELSSDRAQSSRRLLMGLGLPEKRIAKVEGRADMQPLDNTPSDDLKNRRIGIVLLKQ